MSAQVVTLHPQMTAEQIAAWCAEHRMSVTIEWERDRMGNLVTLIHARRELAPGELPAFLRRQGD